MKFYWLVALLAASWPAQARALGLAEASSVAQALARETVGRLTTKSSSVRVDACYERAENSEADRLGLPKRLCLGTLSLVMREQDDSPFSYDAYMSATGSPAAPRMHIGGGAREAGGWELVGSWLSVRSPEQACGRLNSAHASVYVKSTLQGVLLDGPVLVRAFLMDGSPLCPDYARAVHLDYRRL